MIASVQQYSRRAGLATMLLFLVLSATQASKPLHLDSADLPVWAAATAETGKPVAYRGEERQHDVFVYHTPLYLYALGAWFKLFGVGAAQVRMFGTLCALLLGLLTIELYRCILPTGSFPIFACFFWPFFLLNPFTLQGSAIADIDTTIYGPLLCAFLLSVVRIVWANGELQLSGIRLSNVLACSVILAACFWAKLTTVLLFLPFPFLCLWLRFRPMRALGLACAIIGGGILLFLVTFLSWCRFIGIDPIEYHRWLLSYVATRGSSGHAGLVGRLHDFSNNFILMGPFTIKWTGLVSWVAAIVVVALCVWKVLRSRDHRAYTLGLTTAIAGVGSLYYAGQQVSFGNAPFKYYFVFWSMISASPAIVCASLWEPVLTPKRDGSRPIIPSLSRSLPILLTLVFLAAFVVGVMSLKDRSIRVWDGDLRHYWVYWLLPLIVFGLAIWVAQHKHRRLEAAILALILAAIHTGLQLGTMFYQVRQPYSTTYNYGQTGLEETACFIRATSKETDVIVSMKDLGPLAMRPYYENYPYLYGGDKGADRFVNLVKAHKIRYLVFTEGIGEDELLVNPTLQEWIPQHCRLVRSIGNYRVYEMKAQ